MAREVACAGDLQRSALPFSVKLLSFGDFSSAVSHTKQFECVCLGSVSRAAEAQRDLRCPIPAAGVMCQWQ